ncbi:MAG: NUDIX hydrolase [Oscillospiraceae bacterium]|jgi:ADP-ribose pyrophosphatase|nr:NUDIX hydrolase [Oscillospiraceae bacterium]
MNNERLFEKIISQKESFHGRLIQVEEWQVELFDGRYAPREIVRHVGAAAVVPVDAAGYVTLVQQYRVAMGRVMLEIPAGKKDSPEEDALVCARRELSEETGFTAQNWRFLTTIDTSPGFLTERIGLYLATELLEGDTHPDEGEFLSLVRMPLTEAVQKVMAGEITDAKSIAGLLMAWQVLGR